MSEDDYLPTPEDSPFARLGGEANVLSIAAKFYDVMDEEEPALARLHPLDEHGKVSTESRDRFALFLVGWLGGPQHYAERHGHPRLRMRHAHVEIPAGMRDAWLRCMARSLDAHGVTGGLRRFLDRRFDDVATMLVNRLGG